MEYHFKLPSCKDTLIAFLLLSPSLVLANKTNEQKDLFSLSLQDLLKIKVTTSSKFEETIHDAHASISIITKEQIAQFGGNYLHEVLERIVSVNSVSGVMTTISTRAGTPWASLLHHLALINGRPSGNIMGAHNLYSSFPLSSIERIEYIRGPGSVLYGSNAYHGVFNIITKKAKQDGWQAEQKLLLGSFENQTLDGSYRFKQGDFNLALNMLYSDEDGWDAKTFDPELLNVYSRKAFQLEQTLHLDMQYENLSLSHFNNHQERFGNFWDAPETRYIPWFKDHSAKITNGSYTHHFNDNWRLENNYTLIDKTMKWNSNGVADSIIILRASSKNKLLELNLFGQLSDNSTLLAGITREDRIISNSPTIPSAKEQYASFYLQYQQQVNDYFSLMFGGQYVTSLKLKDDVSNKSEFVPRAGLIYDLNKSLALKLLYGEAYRQPQIGERYLNSPGIEKGNPDLGSEKIKTIEAQVYYQSQSSLITFTYYDSKENDLIILSPSGDPSYPLEHNNQGILDSKGIELEFKYQPNNNWTYEFSWSWQENKDKEGKKQTTLMPRYAWKLGIGYNVKDWQLGFYNLHYGDFQDSIKVIPNREVINPSASGFNWATLKASTHLFKIGKQHSVEIALELKNIFNEAVYYPQDVPTFYPINTLPGRAGRSVFLSATYKMK